MKKLASTSMNLSFAESEKNGDLVSIIECILVLMEPEYTLTYANVQRVDSFETIRFIAYPEQLRDIADQFNKWADEAEETLEKFTPKENDQC